MDNFKRKNKGFFNHTSEHNEQVALFQWAALYRKHYPELDLMFAIPNGGLRNIVIAKKLKAEGVKAGVPDIFLPVSRGTYHGLFVEMKRKGGQTTEDQHKWIEAIRTQGYQVEVCFGWEHASQVIIAYLKRRTNEKSI